MLALDLSWRTREAGSCRAGAAICPMGRRTTCFRWAHVINRTCWPTSSTAPSLSLELLPLGAVGCRGRSLARCRDRSGERRVSVGAGPGAGPDGRDEHPAERRWRRGRAGRRDLDLEVRHIGLGHACARAHLARQRARALGARHWRADPSVRGDGAERNPGKAVCRSSRLGSRLVLVQRCLGWPGHDHRRIDASVRRRARGRTACTPSSSTTVSPHSCSASAGRGRRHATATVCDRTDALSQALLRVAPLCATAPSRGPTWARTSSRSTSTFSTRSASGSRGSTGSPCGALPGIYSSTARQHARGAVRTRLDCRRSRERPARDLPGRFVIVGESGSSLVSEARGALEGVCARSHRSMRLTPHRFWQVRPRLMLCCASGAPADHRRLRERSN